ncbi:hypothetical protein AURANDRAFT_64980 [Aureococcus anophagefferens]|uniref:MYND-type domain-containing protein n=1 Tax=Aureococcus anophagefferens TaxID=44056 RepID=F0YCG0_AURAN|nr:hypothetical protein AURANDRAFT_64980 [Aureococcus anophagefferens]EGB07290.1 hypothetical protein AURANDRAFT_64980 [Aureococcus anophagefferens]|eukprot:XP_009037923.1 hypothetical protein AURANDRAFT_64980 [Aureococcus anophagefferens]
MNGLGLLYNNGSGVKLDKKKAERLFRMAADRGDADAQCNLGAFFHSEERVEEGFRYFALAADQGYTYAESNLGLCRLGVVKSDKKAAKIWMRAVELGDVDAMVELGELYYAGLGVKLDKKKAERLYRAAADRGDALAQSNIGAFLHSEKKLEEAFRYYALAANQGYTSAEHNLGVYCSYGAGTEVDLGKARYWFERAAAKGFQPAIESIARLDAQDARRVMSWREKKLEYETRMARARGKKLDTLKTCTICGADKAKACKGCGTTAYCSTDCQRIDWRDRGHRKLGLVKSDKKAAKIWKRAVALGDVEAMNNLGTLYDNGSGVKLDKKKAERLYRAAADRGDAFAQNNLGALLDTEKKFEEAFRYYTLAANQGETFAENSLGCCYLWGEGTEVDVGKARYWFERAAAKGHEKARGNLAELNAQLGNVSAMVRLAELYNEGLGVKLDKKKAERLYRTAADRGHAVAQANLGFLLDSVKKHEEAFRYYALAAEQGFTLAEACLGICYRDGDGTEVDLGKSRYWFERAAAKGNELGDVDAMESLAEMYGKGLGVKLDKKKAERLYRTAADRGSAFAQNRIACLLDLEKRMEEAFRYYALAADQGATFAENSLGCCYRDGEGTEVDLGKARYWFERAAAKGDEPAIEALARLEAQI